MKTVRMFALHTLHQRWCLCKLLLALFLGHACLALADDDAPVWFIDGHPSAEAREAVSLLQSAGDDGLDPDDYQAGLLAHALQDARHDAPLAPALQASLSEALTQAMQTFISDLHFGRIDPQQIHANFDLPQQNQLDAAIYLKDALAGHALTKAVNAARPQLPIYDGLRQALAQYRELEKNNPVLQHPLPLLPGDRLAPGQEYSGIRELARRLIALGDLPVQAKIGKRYGGALVDGVKAFQARHGLTANGVIGKATFAQLNTPIAARIRQIELSMERLRWTPLRPGERMIVVNIPEFVLRAYDGSAPETMLTMNVIVGKALNEKGVKAKALKMRTPLFLEEMRFIEFSPYWNIPPSIAKDETVPRLLRDPAYFIKQGLEFVGSNGAVIPMLSRESLDAVLRGQLRIRQRPGASNALGDIKFVFPNNENIYLHHTPSVRLFKRDRRDFSHGCIRVEDPVALAKFVLQDQPEWTEERIRNAMKKGKSNTLRLQNPLPVVIAYATAIVGPDHKLHFFEDIYENDKLLDQALKKREKTVRGELASLAMPQASP